MYSRILFLISNHVSIIYIWMLMFSLNKLKHFPKTKWVSSFVFVSSLRYFATWISWFHFKKYIVLARLNSNTSKRSQCSAYFFILLRSFFNQRDLLPEYKNWKTQTFWLVNYTNSNVTEMKFQVFILRKKCIFITFLIYFCQSPATASCGVLNFTDHAITLKQIWI